MTGECREPAYSEPALQRAYARVFHLLEGVEKERDFWKRYAIIVGLLHLVWGYVVLALVLG